MPSTSKCTRTAFATGICGSRKKAGARNLWDLSEYNGYCYSYWGIVPAVFHLALPFVHDRAMALLAFTVAVFFFLKMIRLGSAPNPDEENSSPRGLAVGATLLALVAVSSIPAATLGVRAYEKRSLSGRPSA